MGEVGADKSPSRVGLEGSIALLGLVVALSSVVGGASGYFAGKPGSGPPGPPGPPGQTTELQIGHKLVASDIWQWSTSSADWSVVSDLSTTIRVEADSLLVLIANGQTQVKPPGGWLYLSFFVEGNMLPGTGYPAMSESLGEMGQYLNHSPGDWMTANFTQTYVVSGQDYPKDVRVELKVRTKAEKTYDAYVNGMALQIITLPLGA